jgi:hypothetical protein
VIAGIAIGLVLGVVLGVCEYKSSARAYAIPSIRLVQEIRRRKKVRVRR